jgi:hypothetical protein
MFTSCNRPWLGLFAWAWSSEEEGGGRAQVRYRPWRVIGAGWRLFVDWLAIVPETDHGSIRGDVGAARAERRARR